LGEEGSFDGPRVKDEGRRRFRSVRRRHQVIGRRLWLGFRRVGHRVEEDRSRNVGRLQGKLELVIRPVIELLGLTRPMAGSATDWITLAEASEILAASNIEFRPATIGGWARAGKLQSIKLGGRRFVRRGEVRALVSAPRRVRAEELQPALFEDLRR